ncbi:metalloprotease [Acinetobacter baumannii]|uniref:Putative metalloprotease n=1 Tax=Acinetobacter baumannii 99063 TaxID=1310630 RepID=A0A009TKJ3_ACIBA|nr:metalloprotease [Acinetobacter baumannii]EXC51951.1 putative metalloprotease [Acinetobacter baumannii 99063]MBD0477803.1 metalloprotease [Acinetobacter baumannii]MBD0493087.1 metalloprotease [Acinetobacter baumannii]MCG6640239.1 metalloprotease [Acinetobacter baumannii]MCT9504338.1 metalloprotease [Acinetobacter baumannii]
MKKILLLISGILLCVSCTTRPPLQKPDLLEEPGNNRPVVPVTFVFTTNNPSAAQFDNFTQMRKEISILNKYYLDDQGKKIFNFKLNRYIPYEEFSKLHCDLKQQINQPYPISTETIPASVNTCFPKRTASKEVIIFIYDAYSTKWKFKDVTSRAFRNNGKPFILLDWNRLNYNIQAGSVHEMGHVFGLKHVCAPKATKRTPTNIMTSAECKLGSGGLRNLGFTSAQLQTILSTYNQYP